MEKKVRIYVSKYLDYLNDQVEMIAPRDVSYVMYYLCEYYNEEFLNY